MSSRKMFEKVEMDEAQPMCRDAAAGLGQVLSVMKAGEVLLK